VNFPAICPDIPVADLAAALAYYRDKLGFTVDWSADGIGLACISRGATRMFLSNAAFRRPLGVRGPILLWLNLDGRAEIDALYREWLAAGAKLSGSPASHLDAKLYEFFAQDIDGNYIRVFYDYAWEERG
jgi:predicted lactoylglutathione lyase